MEQSARSAPIGVFDSGLGGISVLKELVARLPGESFLFFGDRANAPYGNRSREEVLDLTRRALALFREEGCKAMVIACNTATGVAADTLRGENPDFPIVAIEPALKPAVLAHKGGNILLMATPLAIRTERILALADRFRDDARIALLPCPGLVELIEEGHVSDALLEKYLRTLFADLPQKPDAVVLGCTHYPHVRPALREYFGDGVSLYDGGEGTARRMADVLRQRGLLAEGNQRGTVSFRFSAEDGNTLALARALLQK